MATPLSRSSPQISPLISDDDSDCNCNSASNECETLNQDGQRSFIRTCLSYQDPVTGNTRLAYLFPLFAIINIILYIDRTILPGASLEFLVFVSSANDSPLVVKENPNMGIGLLHGSFAVGYVISLLLSGHFVHKIRWKTLVLISFCVWWLGVLGSGNAKQYNSFYILLFSRMATGCSEATFHVVAPPLIQDRGGKHTGLWLSIYLTGIPVGHNLGYIYGSVLASSDQWGWDWAYYFVCIVSLPPLIVLLFVRDEVDGGILGGVVNCNGGNDDGDRLPPVREPILNALHYEDPVSTRHLNWQTNTLSSKILVCLSSPVLVTVSLGWAAIIGTSASFYAFSVSSVITLEMFDNEREAAGWFGALAITAGVVGTQIGGRLVDMVLTKYIGTNAECSVDDAFRHQIIASILTRINILVALAMIFVLSSVVAHNTAIFLGLLSIGWILFFMTQTGINLISMLAVDRSNRPNASAFFNLTTHLLGDVPIPVVMGLIKDKLAPACQLGPSGEFVDPDRCLEQKTEVQEYLAIIFSWALWSLIFFEIARQFARRQAKHLGRQEAVNSIRSYWSVQKEIC